MPLIFLSRIVHLGNIPGEQLIQSLIEYGLAGMGWFLLAVGVGFISASLIGKLFDESVNPKETRRIGGLFLLIGVGTFMLGLIVSPPDGDLKKYCVTGVAANDPAGLVVHSKLDSNSSTAIGGLAHNARDIVVLGKCENFSGQVWCLIKGKDKVDNKEIKGWVSAESYLTDQEVCRKN